MRSHKMSCNAASCEGLTKDIIIAIASGALITAAVVMPGVGYALTKLSQEKFRAARKQGYFRRVLKRLEKQSVISWKEYDGEMALALTEKGKRKLLRYNVENMPMHVNNRPDGLYRIITFDIPENKKRAREIFRSKLKELGCIPLQKSVFVSVRECKDTIDFLRYSLEIQSHVTYIVAQEISSLSLEKISQKINIEDHF